MVTKFYSSKKNFIVHPSSLTRNYKLCMIEKPEFSLNKFSPYSKPVSCSYYVLHNPRHSPTAPKKTIAKRTVAAKVAFPLASNSLSYMFLQTIKSSKFRHFLLQFGCDSFLCVTLENRSATE